MIAKTIREESLPKRLVAFFLAILAALAISVSIAPATALAADRSFNVSITANPSGDELVYGDEVQFSIGWEYIGSEPLGHYEWELRINNAIAAAGKIDSRSQSLDAFWTADQVGEFTAEVKIFPEDSTTPVGDASASFVVNAAPLTITAKNKTYAYTGQTQGPGDIIYVDDFDKYIIVGDLKFFDKLFSVEADGQRSDRGTSAITLKSAVITNNIDEPVTDNYAITYEPGTLTIADACDVDVTVYPNESGGVSGVGAYEPDATVSLTATPNTGYRFVNWTSEDVTFDDPSKTTIAFKMPPESVDVTANFEEKAKIAVTVTKDGAPQGGLANYLYLATKEGKRLGVVFAYSAEDGKYIYDPVTTQGDQLASGDYVLRLDPPASSGYAASSTNFTYYDDVAQISTTFQYFTIEFVNYDGALLQSGAYTAGEQPKYDGDEPTKPATAQLEYTFAGWNPEVVAVDGKATYTATFTEAARKYAVKFVNYDGTVLQSDKIAYGETPKYAGDEPTRPVTAQYKYVFAGWSPEVVPVTGDATYTATFDEVLRLYTVTWLNYDGTEIMRDLNVPYGQVPEYVGPAPTRPSTAQCEYVFSGWDPEVSKVTGDAAYTATFAAKGTLSFDLAGGTLNGQTGKITVVADVGDTIKLPAAPTREGYKFKCWKGSEYAAGAEYKVEGNHDFTAEWEKNADNGGSGTGSKGTPGTGDGNGGLIIGLSVAAFLALCVIAACLVRARKVKGRNIR